MIVGYHNHSVAKYLEGHSYTGRLTDNEVAIVSDLTKSLVKPRNILLALKQRDKENVTTIKGVYNKIHRNKFLEKAGRSQL